MERNCMNEGHKEKANVIKKDIWLVGTTFFWPIVKLSTIYKKYHKGLYKINAEFP